MELLIILFIVVVILGLIVAASKGNAPKTSSPNLLKENISQISEFDSTHLYVVSNGRKAIGLDAKRQQVGIFTLNKNQFNKRLYHFTDIVEVSIIEDGNVDTTTKTSRSSQVVGAAVGGLLLGGTGVLLGGLSGKTKATSQEYATSLTLRIVVDDLVNPTSTISFFAGKVLKTSPQYQTAKNEISKWNGLLSILLRRAEQLTEEEFKKEKDIAAQLVINNSSEPEEAPVDDEILALVSAGKKIDAIKLYRSQTNVGLREAKDYIDAL